YFSGCGRRMMPTRERFILDVRAIPQWLLEKYIHDLGGVISEEGALTDTDGLYIWNNRKIIA
ncbi:MAG: hypothetical protein WBF05_04370, partial [Anaerolineales bacterium]